MGGRPTIYMYTNSINANSLLSLKKYELKRNPTSRFISHDILLDFLPVPTSNDSEKYLKSCKNKTSKDIPLHLLRKKKSLNSFKALSLISTFFFCFKILASVFFSIKTGNNKKTCDKVSCS